MSFALRDWMSGETGNREYRVFDYFDFAPLSRIARLAVSPCLVPSAQCLVRNAVEPQCVNHSVATAGGSH